MKQTPRMKAMEKRLFLRLERLMEEERPYFDPDLTRKQVAEWLRTNENYLYFAIHHTLPGTTFSMYVNRYRLDYAASLLDENPEIKIENVAMDCGFKTRQTFYRLFRERFGMTPMEYRDRER
ncbi:helix-turn-helix transcriptional regulator [Parabacteroides sp.]